MRTLFVIFFTIALIAPVFAQFDSGQISGFVRDESGAVVPGAVVVATNEGTGEERRTTTNADGYYVFPQLFVGRYSIAVEAAGFKKFLKTGIVLNAEAKVSVSVALTIGAVTDQVEVQASAAQVKTDSADVGTTIDTKQIQNLTLNGRNPVYLAALTPGVVGGQGIGTFDPDSVSNGSFNINGGRPDEYVVMVDGAVATRTRSSGSMLGAMDVDTVQEVQVLTADYSAEYGRSSAGQIRFVTKSGRRELSRRPGRELPQLGARRQHLDAQSQPAHADRERRRAVPLQSVRLRCGRSGLHSQALQQRTQQAVLLLRRGMDQAPLRFHQHRHGSQPGHAQRRLQRTAERRQPVLQEGPHHHRPAERRAFPRQHHSRRRASATTARRCSTSCRRRFRDSCRAPSNWIGTKSTHSDLRKDTFKVDYLISQNEHLSVRGTHTPWHFNAPFEDTFGRMEEVWSRPNRVGAVSLTSTLSPTLVNEFNFSANSDGKGDIEFGSYCTTLPAQRVRAELSVALSGHQDRSREGAEHPHTGTDHARCRSVSRFLVRLRLRLDQHHHQDRRHPHHQVGRLLRALRAERFHPGHHGGTRADRQPERRFHVQRHGQSQHHGPRRSPTRFSATSILIPSSARKAYTPYVANSLDLFAQDSWKVTHKLTL